MTMVSVANIKKDLPAWPDEMIDLWLLFFENDLGWPPPDHRWRRIPGGRPRECGETIPYAVSPETR
jgi:hypothetical protein